ncbi:RNA-metabolizing metallo-beta-lactamase [Rhizobium sp. BK251]|nr:RNA-metabolizing metallo-beta-lactamase [Rhizobium sp. BK251]
MSAAVEFDACSGHADASDLENWVAARKPIEKGVFRVHGNRRRVRPRRSIQSKTQSRQGRISMLSTDRDYRPGSEHFAVPTMGEVEGKLLVSEIVAVACLQELLKHEHAPVVRRVRRRIQRDLKHRCSALKLCADDEKTTADYAFQILKAAIVEARSQ